MIPTEIQQINIEDHIARAELAKNTKDKEVLNFFAPDQDIDVILNIIRNDLFDESILSRIEHISYLLITRINQDKTIPQDRKDIVLKKFKSFIPSDTFCPIPWNHISTMTNGDFRVCCQMITEPFGRVGLHAKDVTDINAVRNSEYFMEIRKALLNNQKHKACTQCWTEERNNLQSKRINMNNVYSDKIKTMVDNTDSEGKITNFEDVTLNYLDLRLGNKCNLACRTCGPTESTLWLNYYGEKNEVKKVNFYGVKEYEFKIEDGEVEVNSEDFDWPSKTIFLEKLLDNIKDIDRIYFTGGEPSINFYHINFLEKLIQLGVAKNIDLEYNSNGMNLPERLLNIWKHFKSIGVGFSIDGTEKRFEYLRYPGKWKKFLYTLKKLDIYCQTNNNFRCTLAPTVSLFNILNFIDLHNFSFTTNYYFDKKIPIHFLEYPDIYNIQIISDQGKEAITATYNNWLDKTLNTTIIENPLHDTLVKESIEENITGLLSYLNTTPKNKEEKIKHFHEKVSDNDQKINMNWYDIFPEIVDYVKC